MVKLETSFSLPFPLFRSLPPYGSSLDKLLDHADAVLFLFG